MSLSELVQASRIACVTACGTWPDEAGKDRARPKFRQSKAVRLFYFTKTSEDHVIAASTVALHT